MNVVLIAFVAFFSSITTFYSGFGLGTMLTPFFCIFFPVQEAIALTALVHFINNLFKFGLLKNHINFKIAVPFAFTAVIASYFGAELLNLFAQQHLVFTYQIGNFFAVITPLKILIALLMLVFVIVEQVPQWSFQVKGTQTFMLGGLISGFFGGLSGNQGALRSMFLLKAKLLKEEYLATGVFIACMVDVSRLSVYYNDWLGGALNNKGSLMIVAVASALSGSMLGKKFIQKVTMKAIQTLIVVLLSLIAILLGIGII